MRRAPKAGIIDSTVLFLRHIFLLFVTLSSMDASDRLPGAVSRSSARCPRCDVAFDCGRSTRPFDCWCAGMPPLPDEARPAGTPLSRCLCPACYADALAASSGRGGAGDAGPAGR